MGWLLFPSLRSVRRRAIRSILGGATVLGVVELSTHLPSEGRCSKIYHRVSDQVVLPLMQRLLTPEQAHNVAIALLAQPKTRRLSPIHRPSGAEQHMTMSQTLFESKACSPVVFPNPIGLAAGFDKDAEAIEGLLDLGFGFVEIGSVTHKPQPGNPSPRMFRLQPDQAIINRYGFNSQGMNVIRERLQQFRLSEMCQGQPGLSGGLVGVNLGKNKTSNAPLQDYQTLIHTLAPFADYFVLNVSSPNTPGLRDLQRKESLEFLLTGCLEARNALPARRPPLLVKLSPDLSNQELEDIGEVLLRLHVDGIIVTNTTTARAHGLQSQNRQQSGGLSGMPLKNRSTDCIRLLFAATEGKIPIIGVGGIFTAQDIIEKMKAGASLVQVYTGLVYKGPGLISRLRHDLAVALRENGFRKVEEVVGLDHEVLYWRRRQQIAQRAIQDAGNEARWIDEELQPLPSNESSHASQMDKNDLAAMPRDKYQGPS